MFIILPPIYFKSLLTWQEAVALCTYMFCVTAIIITIIILHFSIHKRHLKEKAEFEKTNKMAEITRENYRATPCSNYSCSNYSSTKAKAEETGSIAPDNNNETTEETVNKTPNNNNETKGA